MNAKKGPAAHKRYGHDVTHAECAYPLNCNCACRGCRDARKAAAAEAEREALEDHAAMMALHQEREDAWRIVQALTETEGPLRPVAVVLLHLRAITEEIRDEHHG